MIVVRAGIWRLEIFLIDAVVIWQIRRIGDVTSDLHNVPQRQSRGFQNPREVVERAAHFVFERVENEIAVVIDAGMDGDEGEVPGPDCGRERKLGGRNIAGDDFGFHCVLLFARSYTGKS